MKRRSTIEKIASKPKQARTPKAKPTRRRARDDFSPNTKLHLRDEVGNVCSLCARPTSGPSADRGRILSGEAGHIRAAKEGGPRWDQKMTSGDRRSAANGIWLCGKCHPIVDGDQSTHTVQELQSAKQRAIADARRRHLTGSAPGPDPRQVAVATDALKAAIMLCDRVHHAIRVSKQAVEILNQGPKARLEADASLDFVIEELMDACVAYSRRIELVRASFPTVFHPTFEMMIFKSLAATVTIEFAHQWKERFRGERRQRSAMETANPFERMCDWSKAFEGRNPDAAVIDRWALMHERRMTSWAAHIGQGLIPGAWWALRMEDEQMELAHAKAES